MLLLIRRDILSSFLAASPRRRGGPSLLGWFLAGGSYCWFLLGAGTSSGSWSTSDAAAALFSAWTAAQISSRYTGIDLGAAMPMRTLDPLTSITSITTSSPTMIFSPGRRVMMSIWGLLLGSGSVRRA